MVATHMTNVTVLRDLTKTIFLSLHLNVSRLSTCSSYQLSIDAQSASMSVRILSIINCVALPKRNRGSIQLPRVQPPDAAG